LLISLRVTGVALRVWHGSIARRRKTWS
jgi:hypothetical protein